MKGNTEPLVEFQEVASTGGINHRRPAFRSRCAARFRTGRPRFPTRCARPCRGRTNASAPCALDIPLHLRISLEHCQKRPDGKRKIFSGASLSTYMATIPYSPAPRAWCICGLRRDSENRHTSTLRNNMQTLEAIAIQLFAQTFGGDQRCECAVMELAQIGGDRLVTVS